MAGTFTMPLWEVEKYHPDDIGLNDYPIFDEEYRPTLNQKIRNHYYNREIGVETSEMFIFNLRRRMHEIMPLYNELHKIQKMEFDPLISMRMKSEGTAKNKTNTVVENETENTTEGKTSAEQLESTYPQVGMKDGGEYANAGASSASVSTGSGSGKDRSDSEGIQDGETSSTVEGFQGSQSALLMEYARSRMNIDMLIIEDIADLFMGVWGTSDDYTHPHRPYFHSPHLPEIF